MNSSSRLTYNIFEFLNRNSNYAVLRNYEGLPLNNSSRDIDILIARKEFLSIENKIVRLIIADDFKIITLFRSEKIITYVCGKALNGDIDLVQFDFFFNTSLFGKIILDCKEILRTKAFNGNVFHVSKEYEYLDKYLQLKFLNKPYPEKYKQLETNMRQSEILPKILKEFIGVDSMHELKNISTAKFKRKVFIKNIGSKPIEQISLLFMFYWYYLKNMLFYKGFSIGFTGPDGAGKTTVIDLFVEKMASVYSAIKLYHFRPSIIPNLGEAAHKTKLKSQVDKDYSNPHRGGKTSKVSSFIRLLYYSLDYLLGYVLKIRPSLFKRSIVIFDRYYTDIIADSRRSRIFLSPKFLFWFGKLLIPKLNYNILLTANTETILSRKQELTTEGIDNINTKLNYLASKNGYYLILNDGEPSEAIQEIASIILEKQHQKNIKKMSKR